MTGNITRRGKNSWRLKFEAGERDPVTGKRRTRFLTVRGTKKAAGSELIRLLNEVENGTNVEPSKVTVGQYVAAWLDGRTDLAPKTLERYAELIRNQIAPHIGAVALQKLRPKHVQDWHATLLTSGSRDRRSLSALSVRHAHRLLHRALKDAVLQEMVARNAASFVTPPRVQQAKVRALDATTMADFLAGFHGHDLHAIVATALGTGMRRGEICGLQWRDLDLDAGVLTVARSVGQAQRALHIKAPKSDAGLRCITLPAFVIEALRAHRVRRIELCLSLGVGAPRTEEFVFCHLDGAPLNPDTLSGQFRRACVRLGLIPITFHAQRHTHASALIASGQDVVTVSKRLGHSKPSTTLDIYAHEFDQGDAAAAAAMDAAMRKA